MRSRKLLAAIVLAWLGLTGAMAEASFVHTDDGCAIETHCNACLLRLRSTGVVTVTFSLPPVFLVVDEPAPVRALSHEEAPPSTLSSRGPPLA